MAMTPAEWLPVLAKRLDDCSPRVRLLRSYMNGNAPLPEAGKNTRESWKRFQEESRTNWGQLILEAVTDRIIVKGIMVNGDAQSEVAKQAQRIWRDNRMDHVFQEWLRDGLALRQSYLTCWAGDDRRAVITSDSRESMIVAADPLQPWRPRAALRAWRDIDRELDYAIVWSESAWQTFSRGARNDEKTMLTGLVQGKWDPVVSGDGSAEPTATGTKPPVAVYNNPGGLGEYEPHLDLINRINNGILDRRSIQAMEAFRQRALKAKEGTSGLPQKDENGNDIDWAERLPYAPGALWDLPPGIDIWESQQTDIRPLLEASKDDIRQLSAVTRTPLPILMPDNTNTSAAGAIATEAGYITKCGTRLAEAKIGLEAILVKALEVEGVEGLEELTVTVEFEPVERVSTSEKFQAAQAAKGAGLSVKSIQRDILGWGPDEIRQDETDRAMEDLRTMTLSNSVAPQQNRPQQSMPPTNAPMNDRAGNGRPR